MHELFAACAPGCESVLAREIPGSSVTSGGVVFHGGLADVYRVNLTSRIAGRVLVRLGTFKAKDFAQLERGVRALPFAQFVRSGEALAVRVTCHRSRLYHTKAIAERVLGWLSATPAAGGNLDEDAAPPPTLMVRIENDTCTVSIDSSGAHLHKRGYKLASAKAPIRETLAAALLAFASYDGGAFVDPMCGSGTLAIEAGLLAANKAPGLLRSFAFEGWPGFDAKMFAKVKQDLRATERAVIAPLIATDRNEGAINATRENAERAGVHLEAHVRPLSRSTPPAPSGLLLTNPPYGARIGNPRDLRDLYAALGNTSRTAFADWQTGFVTSDPKLARTAGPDFASVTPYLAHGGLKVQLWIKKSGSN